MSKNQKQNVQVLDKEFLETGIPRLVKMVEKNEILDLTIQLEKYDDKLLLQIKAALCNNSKPNPKRLVEFINAELEHRTIVENIENSKQAKRIAYWSIAVSILVAIFK